MAFRHWRICAYACANATAPVNHRMELTGSLEEVGARILADKRRVAGHHDGRVCFRMVARNVAAPLLLLVFLHLADQLQDLHIQPK